MRIDDSSSLPVLPNTMEYQKLEKFVEIEANLKKTDEYFASLDSKYTCLYPSKLYYKILQEGNGPILENQTEVTLHYTIKTPENAVLVDTRVSGQPVSLNLVRTISGFAHGLRGMKIGEIREIVIHPSFAYGIYTNLDKGIYLNANVQLIDIAKNQQIILPELSQLDFIKDIPSHTKQKYEEQTKKFGLVAGYKIWQHYKSENFYQLDDILKYIKQFQLEKTDLKLSNSDSQYILNQLHWNIYQNEN